MAVGSHKLSLESLSLYEATTTKPTNAATVNVLHENLFVNPMCIEKAYQIGPNPELQKRRSLVCHENLSMRILRRLWHWAGNPLLYLSLPIKYNRNYTKIENFRSLTMKRQTMSTPMTLTAVPGPELANACANVATIIIINSKPSAKQCQHMSSSIQVK